MCYYLCCNPLWAYWTRRQDRNQIKIKKTWGNSCTPPSQHPFRLLSMCCRKHCAHTALALFALTASIMVQSMSMYDLWFVGFWVNKKEAPVGAGLRVRTLLSKLTDKGQSSSLSPIYLEGTLSIWTFLPNNLCALQRILGHILGCRELTEGIG